MINNEFKNAIYLIALGAGLVTYGHSNFATRFNLTQLEKAINKIDNRLYQIQKHHGLPAKK